MKLYLSYFYNETLLLWCNIVAYVLLVSNRQIPRGICTKEKVNSVDSFHSLGSCIVLLWSLFGFFMISFYNSNLRATLISVSREPQLKTIQVSNDYQPPYNCSAYFNQLFNQEHFKYTCLFGL